MATPTERHDVLGGAAVSVWVVGMGLVLAAPDASWYGPGAILWVSGVAAAIAVAAHAYWTRSRHRE